MGGIGSCAGVAIAEGPGVVGGAGAEVGEGNGQRREAIGGTGAEVCDGGGGGTRNSREGGTGGTWAVWVGKGNGPGAGRSIGGNGQIECEVGWVVVSDAITGAATAVDNGGDVVGKVGAGIEKAC